MPVLPDHWIRTQSRQNRLIEPFAAGRPRPGKISFGASSYGYDFRLAREFRIPEVETSSILDPKSLEELTFREHTGRDCVIPAGSFVLGRSLEYFRIPRDTLAICQGKSTYARCGLIVNVTPLEPEWEGFITISLVNGGPAPVRVHAGEGIGQVVFLRAESVCGVSYADRKGKYQAQREIRLARVQR
jgi:dCTP deaminase